MEPGDEAMFMTYTRYTHAQMRPRAETRGTQ